MKKVFFLLTSLMIAFASCEKTPEDGSGDNGGTTGGELTVSITADQNFAADNTAKLTVKLSAAAKADVKVTLANADVESGKTKLTADYTKNVTIKAGETSAVVDVEADVFGLEAGEYQAAIKIASADGAKVAENATVYINYSYVYKPEVNLYADTNFKGDKTATLKVALAKATNQDVTVTLADGELSGLSLSYEKTVTIPAGQTEVEVTVTVGIPDGLANGIYPVSINIADVVNGVKGKVPSASINVSYPFSVYITIDSVFDDWNDSNVLTWTLPEGNVLYDDIEELKLAANEKYVYLYAKFYDAGFSFNMPVNIYIDADGNPETGGHTPSVDNNTYYPPYATDNQGLEWYFEMSFHDGDKYNDMYSWGTIYEYNPANGHGLSVFGNLTPLAVGSYDGSQVFCQGIIDENNIAQVEIQFERSFLKMTGDKARFSLKIMDGMNNWSCLGLMPQGPTADLADYTTREHVDMATINLPAYVQ